jgi:hypothetical protein
MKKINSSLDDYTCNRNIINISSILKIDEYFEKEYYFINEGKRNCIEDCKYRGLEYFRHIRGDGNCYYRSVLFQYLEINILERNIKLIEMIYNDIQLTKFDIIDRKTNIEKCIECISKIMVDLRSEKSTYDVYNEFVLNYARNNEFENTLIIWLRLKLFSKLENISNVLYNGIIKLEELAQIDFNSKTKTYNEYLYNNILTYGEEAETLSRYILPKLLGINITTIIWDTKNDFKLSEETLKHSEIYLDTYIKLFEEVEENEINIYILRRDNHYDILYNKDLYFNKYRNYLSKFIYNSN